MKEEETQVVHIFTVGGSKSLCNLDRDTVPKLHVENGETNLVECVVCFATFNGDL